MSHAGSGFLDRGQHPRVVPQGKATHELVNFLYEAYPRWGGLPMGFFLDGGRTDVERVRAQVRNGAVLVEKGT